jgi:hypothetical protein
MSFLSKIFGGGPKQVAAPAVPEPAAPPPTIDQAAVAQDAADRLRRKRGARSTILVDGSGTGSAGTMQPAAKSVLG